DDLADNFSRGFWTFNRSCGGVTYDTPYAAMLDGCVQSFQKGYGPFFLENRMAESNAYAEDRWRLSNDLTLSLRPRDAYDAARHEKEHRIDYGYGDDKNNVEPRLGVSYSPSAEDGWIARLTGGRGNAAIAGGWGRYDGRIFQSIFSQSGANVRFNPPNASLRTFNTL